MTNKTGDKQGISEADFIHAAKQTLDDELQNVDQFTQTRLQAIRKAALQAKSRNSFTPWLIPGGALATTVIVTVLTMNLWFNHENEFDAKVSHIALDDINLLSAEEDIEFLQDLEFYQWLENEDKIG